MSPGEIAEGIGDVLGTPYAVDWDTINSISIVVANVLGAILGFAAVFIAIFMTVITTLDILYLTIPVFRSYIQEKQWDGSNDTKKFRLISSSARIAVEESSLREGRMPITIYLCKRLKIYVICSVIFVLITVYQQPLTSLIRSIVVKAVSSITGVVSP